MKNATHKLVALTASVTMAALSAGISTASAQEAMSMDQLLRAVERGRIQDNNEAREREERFRAERANQDQLLRQAQADKAAAEARSRQLEGQFETNKAELKEVEAEAVASFEPM